MLMCVLVVVSLCLVMWMFGCCVSMLLVWLIGSDMLIGVKLCVDRLMLSLFGCLFSSMVR